jgi:uncharacterized cupin superfamily protein
MPKRIDPKSLPSIVGTFYPPPYDTPCRGRERRALGEACGLTQFGVNLQRLAPGVWSSQRHWHSQEDEFVYVLEGEVVLVTDAGEEILKVGDCAGFKAGDTDGHHIQNRSDRDALLLEIGTRAQADACTYPDIDLLAPADGQPAIYTHRDGTSYTDLKRRGPDDKD